MQRVVFHLSDEQLLKEIDGEITLREGKSIRAHLKACWTCRTRRQELENAISDFVHVHRQSEIETKPDAGRRALLKARLAELAGTETRSPFSRFHPRLWWTAAVACVLVAAGLTLALNIAKREVQSRYRQVIVSSPDSRLTPGAAVFVDRQRICNQAAVNNKDVPDSLRRVVLGEYGISERDMNAYEVDYLITPALGGADDIHNLWPQSYSATIWNSQVKDALESRLRQMVCDGSLDLATAQQDLAENWIAAYKQYFHTDRPLQDNSR